MEKFPEPTPIAESDLNNKWDDLSQSVPELRSLPTPDVFPSPDPTPTPITDKREAVFRSYDQQPPITEDTELTAPAIESTPPQPDPDFRDPLEFIEGPRECPSNITPTPTPTPTPKAGPTPTPPPPTPPIKQ